jgi:hypothetical protein
MKLCLNDFFWVAAGFAFFASHGIAEDEVPKNKIVHATLNHDDLAVVKVGTTGVTSLEFPYKIEAIDGYGFSATPAAGDAFQLTYSKGTNYLSVRALKLGATGNLTVVLDQKVYSIFFTESSDPSFVNIFELPADNGLSQAAAEKRLPVAPAQISGLLDAARNYTDLQATHPETLEGLHVAELGKKSSLTNGIESTIRRVLEDDGIGAAAFEVEIDNRTNDDFTYDPQSFEIKGKEQIYDVVSEEAAGTVKAGSSATVYLVVNESGASQPDGLIADSELKLALKDRPKNPALTFDQPTSSYLPTAVTVQPPPDSTGPSVVQNRVPISDPQPTATPSNHTVAKKAGRISDSKSGANNRKSDSKSEANNAKGSIAKSQKTERKKLFGWL